MDKFAETGEYAITIVANGQLRNLKAGSTIGDLLQELNISSTRVVAQLNGVIVPRSELNSTLLHANDQLELVTMVGGG
jgi:thiamine biosynthesis protein ThiS